MNPKNIILNERSQSQNLVILYYVGIDVSLETEIRQWSPRVAWTGKNGE